MSLESGKKNQMIKPNIYKLNQINTFIDTLQYGQEGISEFSSLKMKLLQILSPILAQRSVVLLMT